MGGVHLGETMKDKLKLYGFAAGGKLVKESDGGYTFYESLDTATKEQRNGERVVHVHLLVTKLPR